MLTVTLPPPVVLPCLTTEEACFSRQASFGERTPYPGWQRLFDACSYRRVWQVSCPDTAAGAFPGRPAVTIILGFALLGLAALWYVQLTADLMNVLNLVNLCTASLSLCVSVRIFCQTSGIIWLCIILLNKVSALPVAVLSAATSWSA